MQEVVRFQADLSTFIAICPVSFSPAICVIPLWPSARSRPIPLLGNFFSRETPSVVFELPKHLSVIFFATYWIGRRDMTTPGARDTAQARRRYFALAAAGG